MKKVFIFLVVLFLATQSIVFAQDYRQYKNKKVIVTIKAENDTFLIKGILHDVVEQRKKVFYENETFYHKDRSKTLIREVDKQYLIIRHKQSEYMIDSDNVICIEVKKW